MSDLNPRFECIATITRHDLRKNGWHGEMGHITQEMLEKWIGDIKAPIYYIAGPPGDGFRSAPYVDQRRNQRRGSSSRGGIFRLLKWDRVQARAPQLKGFLGRGPAFATNLVAQMEMVATRVVGAFLARANISCATSARV
jgi:NAD(P)H-flavin reductase